MSKRQVQVEIRARNKMQAGLAKARAALKNFGASAKRIAGMFAKAFLVAGTAIAAFAGKAIAVHAVQEKAEKSLSAALKAHGEEVEGNTERIKQLAAAIQDETGVADENTIAQAAQLKMLGVSTAQMDEAIKATIGLKAAGLDGATATRAVAAAMQGNYTMLTRYIPELRSAKDETEKARIVNEFFAKGYAQQKDLLNTTSGQWNALKGRVGDAMEQFGKAIAQNDTLAKILEKVGNKVKWLGEKIAEWADSGGVDRLIIGFKYFYEQAVHYLSLVGNGARVTWASISDGVDTAFTYISNIVKAWADGAISTFHGVAEIGKSAFELLKDPSRETWENLKGSVADYKETVKNSFADLGAALMGEEALVTERTEAALAERESLHQQHRENVAALSKEQAQMQIEQQEKVVGREKLAEKAKLAEVQAAKQKKIELWKAYLEKRKQQIEEAKEAEKAALAESVEATKEAAKEKAEAAEQADEFVWQGRGGIPPSKAVGGGTPWVGEGGRITAMGQSTLTTGTGRIGGVGLSSVAGNIFGGNGKLYSGFPMMTTVYRDAQGKILKELQDINRNQKKLLTFG